MKIIIAVIMGIGAVVAGAYVAVRRDKIKTHDGYIDEKITVDTLRRYRKK